MNQYNRWTVMAVAFLAFSCAEVRAEQGVDVPFYGSSVARFASLADAKELLGRSDYFVAAMSRFDRQCRMTTAVEPTDDELLRFLSAQAVPWEPKQIEFMTQRLQVVRKKLSGYRLSLPERIIMIQTTGKDEGNAAYCRYPAIVLPQQITRKNPEEVERLLIHETFHIMSVHNEDLRRAMYELIGFHVCVDVELPFPFANRKITNPDAPLLNCWIDVEVNGKRVPAAPLLYSSAEQFDPSKGGTLFKYLQFRLMLLKQQGNTYVPLLGDDDQPILVDPKKVPSYFDQIGKNTDYIIHPDEILADNFAFMVLNRPNLATPQLIEKMKKTLLTK